LQWRTTLGEILPASFRITKDVPTYFQNKLENELQTLLKEATEYQPVEGAEELPGAEDPRRAPLAETDFECRRLEFLPHAYQLALDRSTIRKNPALQALHTWLKQTVASGHVTRQETVSMVPPVLLHVQQSDTVLDMCAAPGSKTSQLLEDLSVNASSSPSRTAASTHGGVLIANDASAPRAQMLASQLRRILHHHPVALITAAPAQHFPANITQFDKILCDVPCTGDGTTRKNIQIWKNWTASGGLALHALQLQIAVKGTAQLLRVGGVLCYSTCSANPMENEAVVAELLRQGSLELVEDCASLLEGFKTRPGLSTWKVLCEEKSNRQLRNQQRQQKSESREDGDVKPDSGDVGESKPEDAAVELEGEKVETTKDTDNEDDVEPKSIVRKFEPTSFDESLLIEMADSAGLKHYASFRDVPENMQSRIPKSAFPPTPEEAAEFHLERCIRCLPHDNNTGGFFVALLRKTAPMSATDRRNATTEPEEKKAKLDNENEDAEPADDAQIDDADDDNDDDDAMEGLDADNKPIRGRKIKGNLAEGGEFGKDDFKQVSDDIMQPLIDFYGLSNGFEKELYMARACSDSKVIYYIAKPVRHLFDLGIQKRVTSK